MRHGGGRHTARMSVTVSTVPVSMPRRPGAGPVLAYMTAPSRAASAGPAEEWKTVQLWPTTAGPAVAHR